MFKKTARNKLLVLTIASLTICCCTTATSLPNQKLTLSSTSSSTLSHSNYYNQIDAPKYYHLNALLYKGPRGDESSHSAASPMGPLDGAHIKASGMDMEHSGGKSHDGDEESSIDSLIEAMKRRKAKEMAEAITNDGKGIRTMGADDIVPDDEATIQRKSTDVAEDSAGFPEASRLRSRGN